jgi:hypothetical protein
MQTSKVLLYYVLQKFVIPPIIEKYSKSIFLLLLLYCGTSKNLKELTLTSIHAI